MKLVGTLRSWVGVVEAVRATQVPQAQVGICAPCLTYDLPDLAASLGPKLTVQQPAAAWSRHPRPARLCG